MRYSFDHLLGCYRKFKSFVYYSNNHHYLYSSIASFESNEEKFNAKLNEIIDALNNNDEQYFDALIESVSIVPLIKKIKNNEAQSNLYLNNGPYRSSVEIESLNYFIKCPIHLFLIDTLWTLICFGTIRNNLDIFKYDYAYYPAKDLLNSKATSIFDCINFKSLSLYEPYFEKYKDWQKTVIDKALERHSLKLDSKIVSLDISGFFYSASIDFSKLNNNLCNFDNTFIEHSFITSIVRKIYNKYKKLLNIYALNDEKEISESPIPIGLISSGFVSNFLLSDFDSILNNTEGIILANRYVDDVLILMDGNLKKTFKELVSSTFSSLLESDDCVDESFRIKGTNLIIKNEKTRLYDIKRNGSNYILRKLKKEIFLPSGIKLFPKYVSDFDQLFKRSVDSSKSLKIRDNIFQPNVNPSKMASSLSGFHLMTKDTCDTDSFVKSCAVDIFNLINSEFVVSTYTRWAKLFSYFISNPKNKFNTISSLFFSTIGKIKFSNRRLPTITKKAVKDTLYSLYETAIAESISPILPKISKNDRNKEVDELALLLLNANLFDHNSVSFPMANYLLLGKQEDLSRFDNKDYLTAQIDNRKIKLSPRFIHLDEYLLLRQHQYVLRGEAENLNYQSLSDEYYSNILPVFSFKQEKVSIIGENVNGYRLFNVEYNPVDKDFDEIPIALANIDLSKYNLSIGSGYNIELTFAKGKVREKTVLLDLLNDCYFKKIVRKNKNKNEVDDDKAKFLVFPEYYLPLEWLSLLIKFSRKTGITIVTGIRPVRVINRVLNLQTVILPFKDVYGHSESLVFMREKNNYVL